MKLYVVGHQKKGEAPRFEALTSEVKQLRRVVALKRDREVERVQRYDPVDFKLGGKGILAAFEWAERLHLEWSLDNALSPEEEAGEECQEE